MSEWLDSGVFPEVPLFPLPNVVLFPRAVLPLHIFEERYKVMTADALSGEKLIAMALLKPGWETSYYQRPEIEPIVCIGEILSWERLQGGNFNFLLQGKCRARVVRELEGKAYRVAEMLPLEEVGALEIDLEEQRGRLLELFTKSGLAALPTGRQFRQILGSPLPTADIADLAAFNFLEDVELKQGLLEEADVRRRVGRIVEALAESSARINPALYGLPADPSSN